jgi:hypothetical protein
MSRSSLVNLLGEVSSQLQAQAANIQEQQHQSLSAALAAQRSQVQIAQFQQQVEAAGQLDPVDPDIGDLADHFSLSDPLARRLHDVMSSREETFENDILTLWDVLGAAEDPNQALLEKLTELANNSFVAKSENHEMCVRFCKKYKLDTTATKHLIEVLAYREREHETSMKRDLEKLAVHLEHSSAPSKLISMKLKEIRGGCNIGAVWHCCGDSKNKKAREFEKEPPPNGGPGIEGVYKSSFRTKGSATGRQRSYTDRELEQRFGASSGGGGGLMTEEQALKFTRNMRCEEEAMASPTPSRSRSRRRTKSSRGAGGRSRSRRRTKSRSERPKRGRRR